MKRRNCVPKKGRMRGFAPTNRPQGYTCRPINKPIPPMRR